ncbi:MAG: PEP-CTERM sorting domain-containing protein, partial [Thermoguttaceae bacterium]|nr:PEP-CTERM sorting domain-containing protein [Thermoguttaceae bacterium]
PNELVGMDVLSWDFSSTDLYGANGVAVIGLHGNEVPEPSAWILLALGCGLLGWTRNRKKA